MNLTAVELKAFVPARDFARSKAFYLALGFEIPWASEDLAHVRCGRVAFLLQRFYVPEHAGNFVMHLLVENADDWHARILAAGAIGEFGASVSEPRDQPWGIRDFTLTDPSGVLWRIGHNTSPAACE